MICCQFIFKPGRYDEEFHRLDQHIDAFARALPGFVSVETWTAPEHGLVNAIYYFTDRASVSELARFPAHREAKDQVHRWYEGYRIVISEVTTTYGDDHLTTNDQLNAMAGSEIDKAESGATERKGAVTVRRR